MSREPPRKGYFSRDPRNRDRGSDWNRPDFRGRPTMGRKSRSPERHNRMSDLDKRRSRSPRKTDKDSSTLDDNILSEISKLPEPSELWDNQFHDSNYAGPPPGSSSFPPEPPQPYASNYQPSYSGIYDDFPPVASVPPTPLPPDISSWNQMSLPPPPTASAPPPSFPTPEDQMKKEAAIESEMRHQKAALSKQREDYMKKAAILKKELNTLKDQRSELKGDVKRSPSPDTKRFLKENTKLQLEIQNKLKTINNVVDMLDGIIGEEAQELPDDLLDSPDRLSSKRKSRSPSTSQKFNYVYYDPEMHWCRVCNEFPSTAKDYLNHLHSVGHHKMAAAHMEAPWHSVSGVNEGFPSYTSAPTKRTPIKGLQFFVPSTAWYCKLCDQFIGDLHCASAHLKSVTHSKNYTNFVEQNPHWETDWMSDRQKSFEKVRSTSKNKPAVEEKPQYTAHTITFNKDGFHTKRKNSPAPAEEEAKKKKERKKKSKRKKSTSSSSSETSSSDSEVAKKKKKKKDKVKIEPDDKTLQAWMSSIQSDRLNDSDRKLLDTLKTRMKMEKQEEKRRSPSIERSSRNSETRHRELRERDRERERERERERSRARERERREESRRRDDSERREERRSPRRRSRSRSPSPRQEPKKPEIRKMPFIGKMPVYKSLGKNTKTEEQKKEEEKKKEEDEASKKRREEMDAEIQKKVAEFKEKIAKAQLERQQQVAAADIPPPAVALPTALGSALPAPQYVAPPPAPQPQPLPPPAAPPPANPPAPAQPPALPKDFQDALDIIFPSAEVKQELAQQDMFSQLPPGLPPGFPMGLSGFMPPCPPFLQPQMPGMMMGFDMNTSIFPPRHQLYDGLLPTPKTRPQKPRINKTQTKKTYQNNPQTRRTETASPKVVSKTDKAKANGDAAKKKEEMDDLAMLGIDASDVGAGI